MTMTVVDVLTSLDFRRPNQPPPTFPNGFDDQILAAKPDVLSRVREEFERLDELSRLRANWDHEGGEPITAAATLSSRRVLRAFAAIAGFVPQVVPCHSGGTLIEIRSTNLSADLEITPAGAVEFLVSRGDEELDGTIPAEQVPALLQVLYATKRNEIPGLSG